jgi:hypothetical protein
MNYDTPAEGNLPNAASGDLAEATRIESGAGPDICQENAQDEIERVFGPADWHNATNCVAVDSKLPESCTGAIEKSDATLP